MDERDWLRFINEEILYDCPMLLTNGELNQNRNDLLENFVFIMGSVYRGQINEFKLAEFLISDMRHYNRTGNDWHFYRVQFFATMIMNIFKLKQTTNASTGTA